MNKDAQVKYIKGQIEDIDMLLDRADAGYEVGDTNKLEAQKEILENKLTKLVGEPSQQETNINAAVAEEEIKRLARKHTKWSMKTKIVFAVFIFAWMTFVAICGVRHSIEVNNNNSQKAYCYKMLINEDEIGNGCEQYFENDQWYQDYLAEVKALEDSKNN